MYNQWHTTRDALTLFNEGHFREMLTHHWQVWKLRVHVEAYWLAQLHDSYTLHDHHSKSQWSQFLGFGTYHFCKPGHRIHRSSALSTFMGQPDITLPRKLTSVHPQGSLHVESFPSPKVNVLPPPTDCSLQLPVLIHHHHPYLQHVSPHNTFASCRNLHIDCGFCILAACCKQHHVLTSQW